MALDGDAVGLGPNGTSLLTKLGKRAAWEMTTDELESLVMRDQARRQIKRAMGRLTRILRDAPRPSPRQKQTLEELGLAPLVITGLRKSGKSDAVIIKAMREKGLL